MTKTNYQYYVEGEDERCLVNALKKDLQCIQTGKVDRFNAIQECFSAVRIRALNQNTVIILVYDTDVENTSILRKNIQFLKKQKFIKDVICIPQIKKMEEELSYACNIKDVKEITHSRTIKDFKRDIISCTNLGDRLEKCGFDIDKFWSRIPVNKFSEFGNDAKKIKR